MRMKIVVKERKKNRTIVQCFFLFGRVPGATGMAVIVCDDREKLIPAKSVPVKLGARSYMSKDSAKLQSFKHCMILLRLRTNGGFGVKTMRAQ